MPDMYEDCFGEMVDLDEEFEKCDPNNLSTVRLDCIKLLGYARMYMDYVHPELDWKHQRGRVTRRCEELVKLRKKEYDEFVEKRDPNDKTGKYPEGFCKKWDQIWFKFHYRIGDEIENLC